MTASGMLLTAMSHRCQISARHRQSWSRGKTSLHKGYCKLVWEFGDNDRNPLVLRLCTFSDSMLWQEVRRDLCHSTHSYVTPNLCHCTQRVVVKVYTAVAGHLVDHAMFHVSNWHRSGVLAQKFDACPHTGCLPAVTNKDRKDVGHRIHIRDASFMSSVI